MAQKLKITRKHCEQCNKTSCCFLLRRALVSLGMTHITTSRFLNQSFFKNLDIILLKKIQVINRMVLSSIFVDYKDKQFFTNAKISPTTQVRNPKTITGDLPNGNL